MKKFFEYKGKWKIPGTTEWYNGTLTYDHESGTSLDLFGTFNGFLFDQSSQKIIIGETTDGEITLIDNWYRGTKSSNIYDVTIGKYEPQFIIKGHTFDKISDIKFDSVTFQAFNLFQWISKTGQKRNINYRDAKNYTIEYSEIKPIKFELNKGIKGEITFDGPISFGDEQNDIKLWEESYVQFKYPEQHELMDILNDISQFISSITFFTHEQSYPTNIVFDDKSYTKVVNKIEQPKFIHFTYRNTNYSPKHKLRRRGQFLLNYDDIKKSYPTVIQKWFDLYDEIDSVMLLLIKLFKNKYHFSSDRFMDNIRALENFHRTYFDNNRIPEEKFENLREEIISQVSLEPNEVDWLKNRLMGNEPSLSNRLKDLIDENESEFIKKRIEKIKKFRYKTTNARNYYTHFDKKLKEKIPNREEFFEINQIIRAILISSVIRKLDIDTENIETGLKYHLA